MPRLSKRWTIVAAAAMLLGLAPVVAANADESTPRRERLFLPPTSKPGRVEVESSASVSGVVRIQRTVGFPAICNVPVAATGRMNTAEPVDGKDQQVAFINTLASCPDGKIDVDLTVSANLKVGDVDGTAIVGLVASDARYGGAPSALSKGISLRASDQLTVADNGSAATSLNASAADVTVTASLTVTFERRTVVI
jgi:hypothetical protein